MDPNQTQNPQVPGSPTDDPAVPAVDTPVQAPMSTPVTTPEPTVAPEAPVVTPEPTVPAPLGETTPTADVTQEPAKEEGTETGGGTPPAAPVM